MNTDKCNRASRPPAPPTAPSPNTDTARVGFAPSLPPRPVHVQGQHAQARPTYLDAPGKIPASARRPFENCAAPRREKHSEGIGKRLPWTGGAACPGPACLVGHRIRLHRPGHPAGKTGRAARLAGAKRQPPATSAADFAAWFRHAFHRAGRHGTRAFSGGGPSAGPPGGARWHGARKRSAARTPALAPHGLGPAAPRPPPPPRPAWLATSGAIPAPVPAIGSGPGGLVRRTRSCRAAWDIVVLVGGAGPHTQPEARSRARWCSSARDRGGKPPPGVDPAQGCRTNKTKALRRAGSQAASPVSARCPPSGPAAGAPKGKGLMKRFGGHGAATRRGAAATVGRAPPAPHPHQGTDPAQTPRSTPFYRGARARQRVHPGRVPASGPAQGAPGPGSSPTTALPPARGGIAPRPLQAWISAPSREHPIPLASPAEEDARLSPARPAANRVVRGQNRQEAHAPRRNRQSSGPSVW